MRTGLFHDALRHLRLYFMAVLFWVVGLLAETSPVASRELRGAGDVEPFLELLTRHAELVGQVRVV